MTEERYIGPGIRIRWTDTVPGNDEPQAYDGTIIEELSSQFLVNCSDNVVRFVFKNNRSIRRHEP